MASDEHTAPITQWAKHNPRGVVLVALMPVVLSYPVIWDHALGQPDWYWIHVVYLVCLGLWIVSVLLWKPNTSLEEEFNAHAG